MFGIDLLSFYTPGYYLDLEILAKARNIAPEKLYLTLGQREMAITPPDEDVVTMASEAAKNILSKLNKNEIEKIEMLLFATESGIDQSKSAGIYVHSLLGLPKHCRVLELKQACYSATAGLSLALALLRQKPEAKILLIASDVARYSIGSAAETSQGGGACAMLLASSPRTLKLDPQAGFYTDDVMDFWRPNYCEEAIVDGRYSCEIYLQVLEKCWQEYARISQRNYSDHDYFCYHIPVPKVAEMAHRKLAKINGVSKSREALDAEIEYSLQYSRHIGNCYTASLYIGIISLLDKCSDDLSLKRIGLYSYGSGCSGEYFSASVSQGYRKHLFLAKHKEILAQRKPLSYEEYISFYNFKLPCDGSIFKTPISKKVGFRLSGIKDHKRIYELN